MILDGRPLAAEIKAEVRDEVKRLGSAPTLSVYLWSADPASELYVRKKKEACEEVGISCWINRPPPEARISADLLAEQLANDWADGVLVQLPIPRIDVRTALDSLDPLKDVDGLTATNMGRLLSGRPVFEPCTPAAVMALLARYDIPVHGKHAVVINDSDVVGKPLAAMLLAEDATVTVCHKDTPVEMLKGLSRSADIVVAAVGRRDFLTAAHVNKDAVVIDVGINRDNGRVYGDVCEDVKSYVQACACCPGGVGPVTVAMLMKNTLKAMKITRKWL